MAAVKRLVDTSAWIEWLTASPLGKKLGKELPDKPHCIVPTIVQLELSKSCHWTPRSPCWLPTCIGSTSWPPPMRSSMRRHKSMARIC